MTDITAAGVFSLGNRTVNRMGYGAMQLAGPGVFGPPKDRGAALAVLARGGGARGQPHRHQRFLWPARHQPDHSRGASSLSRRPRDRDQGRCGARRRRLVDSGAHARRPHARRPRQSPKPRVDALDVVNLRVGGVHGPSEGSIEEQFATLAELQRQGLIRQLGLSNVTSGQLKQARGIAEVVCVQNHYNLVHRDDDALIDELAGSGIAYVPFFPLGGFTPLQSSTLSEVATQLGATPMQVALAWLLHRAPNILLIPGTSSIAHLHENSWRPNSR